MTARPLASRLLAAAALAAALTGCTVGPDYVRPAGLPAGQPLPDRFKEAQGWRPASPMAALDKGSWWTVFSDPTLDGLEARVTVTNQNVAQAEANYRQARALVAESRSEFFPTLTSSLSFQRTGSLGAQSGNIATTGAGGTIVTSSNGAGAINRFNGSLDASWAPDLWGRIRRTVEESRDNAQASAADLANATLSAQAELAIDYFELRLYDEDKRLLADTVAAYDRALTVVQNQYNAGVVARADLISAQTQVLDARAALIDVDQQRAAREHAIAVLVGQVPASFGLAPGRMPATVPVAPTGLASTLLQRRPDISSAERAVAASNANIGIQVSAYYPDLTLSGSLGASADDFGRLFRASNSIWSLGSSAAETLIDFGARRARVRQARAAYDASVAAYRQTVLTAFQGVEDQLAALRVLEQEATVRQQALASARRAEALALNRYRSGLVDLTTVITAQAQALNAAQTALSVSGNRLTASVSLIQNLGGGWTTADLPTP